MTRPFLLASLALSVPLTAASPARADGPTKQECVEADDAGQGLRHAGKLRQAREHLALCTSASCPAIVRDDCTQRLAEVDSATPHIVFEAKDAAGNDSTDVAVTVDSAPLADRLAGSSLKVDPGAHVFVLTWAGHPPVTKKLVLAEHDQARRERVVFGTQPSPASSPAPSPMLEPAPPAASNGRSPVTWVAFGVGGAGLLLGGTAGLVAGGKHSTLSGECNNSAGTCAAQYAGDLDAFHTWRTVSTIGYVVGALGVVGGAVLWLTAPKAHGTTAQVWLGPASAGIKGRF